MRTAVFTDVFPSLSETFIARQLEGLLELGHTVHIYANDKPDPSIAAAASLPNRLLSLTTYLQIPPASGYWEMPVVPLWGRTWLPGRASSTPNSRRLLSALPSLARALLLAPKLCLQALDPARYGYRARSLSTVYRLSQLLHGKGKYDIAHAHFGPVADNIRFVSELWRLPLVVSFHGYDVGAWPREKGSRVYTQLFRAATMVTSNSSYTSKRLKALGCPQHKIRLLHMGLDLSLYPFRERTMPSDPDARINILSVGRLVEKKGFEYSMRAVALALEAHPNLHYEIVGDGPLLSRLRELARELGLQDVLALHGAGSESYVRSKMAEAHIFLVPSVTASNGDTEGQGLVLQEAQACGLPVLATDHNGFPEGMLPGRSGFLVPERDVPAMAAKLAYMVERAHSWPDWGRAGRAHVEANYDIRKLSLRLEKLYRQAINSYRSGERLP
jgi:colanic acid/amylovoran biosynthesis glycosyltransferase